MPALAKPIRETRWQTTGPLLIASLLLHGLILVMLSFVGAFGTRGNGSLGSSDSAVFSITWIPGSGDRQEKNIDTVVPDGEDGVKPEIDAVPQPPPKPPKPPLVTHVTTDPEAIFNAETAESNPIDVGSTSKTLIQQELGTKELTPTENRSTKKGLVAPIDPKAEMSSRSSPQPNSETPFLDGKDLRREGHNPGDKNIDGVQPGAAKNRVEFFGIAAQAKRVVYVIDASESMRQHHAMELARQKLWDSLQELKSPSQFQIVFFNLTNHTMNRPGEKPQLLLATDNNRRLARQFVTGIQPDSGTDRMSAMMYALRLNPDVIYLLTDADDPKLSAKDLSDIKRENNRKALIHVVEFGIGGDLSKDSFLKRLAFQNLGEHYYHDLTTP